MSKEEIIIKEKYNVAIDEEIAERYLNVYNANHKDETFDGQITGKFNFEHFLTPKILDLCIGAKIMVTKNISSQNLANGDMGKIVDFGTDYVDIETKGRRCRVFKEKWQRY